VTLKGATNGEGNYFFSFLIPGMYSVTAERAGFKRLVRNGIEVNVNARLELNLVLEIGAVTDTVNVTAEAPLLDTTNASIGRVVDGRETRELSAESRQSLQPDPAQRRRELHRPAIKDQPWQTLKHELRHGRVPRR